MKSLFSLTALFCSVSLASAQTSKTPFFYQPVERLIKSETTQDGKREIIERRTFIMLGFLPHSPDGSVSAETRRLTSEIRDYNLEAHVNGRDFNDTFAALKTEVLKADLANFQPKTWQFRSPASSSGVSGWSVVPANNLRASERCGFMMYCVYVQRFTIEGSRNNKDISFNIGGNKRDFHYKASINSGVGGPILRPLEKGRPFDFQTLPTREQMEELYSRRYSG